MLTGAAGFVGSHAIRHLLANTDDEIVAPVSFRHRGLARRIESAICDQPGADRLHIVHWDMRTPADTMQMREFEGCEVIWNIASESHVDRSIEHPVGFIANNTLLVLNALQVARRIQPRLFLQMSTDEVYGPAYGDHRHREWEPIAPSNPYSASKAAQEAICFSYWRTYGVPLIVTNTMNILGEMQDPEKFLPMIIRNLRDRQPITVHTAPDGTPGSRYYLHARNLADAWLYLTRYVLEAGGMEYHWRDWQNQHHVDSLTYDPEIERPLRFHIVGEREVDNVTLVKMVAEIMGVAAPGRFIERVSFHASRPGHDLRYALDGTRMTNIGWTPPVPLDKSIETTVRWTLEHEEWLDL